MSMSNVQCWLRLESRPPFSKTPGFVAFSPMWLPAGAEPDVDRDRWEPSRMEKAAKWLAK